MELRHQSDLESVAQRPWACSRKQSASAFSRGPDATIARPSLCTWSMSVCAFGRGYPNSFWKTHVTYDMRLIGSLWTMTSHGLSARVASPESGVMVRCGAIVCPPIGDILAPTG